jgi:hypothetical protein
MSDEPRWLRMRGFSVVMTMVLAAGCGGHSLQEPSADPSFTDPDPKYCPDHAYEPNDDTSLATPIGIGHSVGWAICTRTDVDYYRLQLDNNDQVRILLEYSPIGTTGNLDMVFWGGTIPEKMPVMSFPDQVGKILVARALTTTSAAETDTFYLKVFAAADGGGANFYDLEVTPAR